VRLVFGCMQHLERSCVMLLLRCFLTALALALQLNALLWNSW
jgi:hypothetical protein